MRALLGGERTTIQGARVGHTLKVEITNGSGTWIDYTAFCLGGGWSETIDQPVSTGTLRFRRAALLASLAPLMTLSTLNVNDALAYAPAIDVGRLIRINTATHTIGGALTYREVFTGRVDAVEWSQDPIDVAFSDLGAWLMDTQIEEERKYGSEAGVLAETVLQSIVTKSPDGGPAVTLSTPTSPGWMLHTLTQSRVKVLEALRALAVDGIGWDVRYRYDAAHLSRLTFMDPDRDRVTVDTTIGPTEYTDVRRLSLSLADVRNAGKVRYKDTSGVELESILSNAASIALFRRRYFELTAPDSIDTGTEADTLVSAIVNDLSGAPAEQEVVLPYFWPVQLYDRYTFTANGVHYDTDQTLAVVGFSHAFENGEGVTTLTCTGRVVGAYAAWLKGLRFPTPAPIIADFDWTDSAVARTFTWRRSAATEAIWVYDTLVAVGGGSGWPVSGQLPNGSPAILLASTDSYVAPIPPTGFQRFLQLEPRTNAGVVGDLRRSVIDAAPVVGLTYNQVLAVVTTSTATVHTVTVTATAPSGTPTVQLVAVTGSATLLSGPAIGVPAPSGQVWTFTRGAAIGGSGQAQFRGVFDGNIDDDDLVELPEQGRDTVALASRARATANTATTITVRYAVADPFPQGAASVTVTYQDQGSAGVSPASGGTITPAATLTEAAGTYIDYTITRPAFASGGGRVTFTATAAGRVTDSDAVDVPAQEKTSFGPTLNVTATPGATTYSITWSGAGAVVSIDGAAYGAPSASPITVARPAAGSPAKAYTFQNTLDGVTITNAVTVPSLDLDTVTPDLVVTPAVPTATAQDFTHSASNPAGGTAPTVTVRVRGTTGSHSTAGALADGTEVTISGGTTTVTRPAFGTTTNASVEFKATISGGGIERIQRTVLNQVKDFTVPTLVLSPTVSSTTYSIAFTSTGTVQHKVGTGAFGASTSPVVITRTSADQVVTFKATLNGQDVYDSVTVNAVAGTTPAPSITALNAFDADNPGDGGGSVFISWISTNVPAGSTYDLSFKITVGNTTPPDVGGRIGITSPYELMHPLGPAAPSGRFTITAKLDGVVIAVGVFPEGAFALL